MNRLDGKVSRIHRLTGKRTQLTRSGIQKSLTMLFSYTKQASDQIFKSVDETRALTFPLSSTRSAVGVEGRLQSVRYPVSGDGETAGGKM